MKFHEDFYESLSEYLEKFPWDILERGEDIYTYGNIDLVTYDPTIYTFKATVLGSSMYSTSFKMNKTHTAVMSTSCDCPYTNKKCKHVAALITYIIDYGAIYISSNHESKKNKKDISTTLNGNTETQTTTLKGKSLPGILYDLPYLKVNSLKLDMHQYKLNHILEDDNLVRSKVSERYWNNSIPIHETEFLFGTDSIQIQCEDCDYHKDKLCAYAAHALINILSIVIGTENTILDYTKTVNRTAEKDKIDPDIIKEHFEIAIGIDGFSIYSISDELIKPDKINTLSKLYKKQSHIYENGVLNALETNVNYGEAFSWSSESGNQQQNIIFLIKGKLNKNKDKITSNVEPITKSILLSVEAQEFYESVYRAHLDYESNGSDDFAEGLDQVLHIMQQSTDVLTKNLHYFYNPYVPLYLDEKIKVKKKDLSQFEFSDQLFGLHIKAKYDKGLYSIEVKYTIGDEIIVVSKAKKVIFNIYFVIIDGIAYIYKNPDTRRLNILLNGNEKMLFLPKSRTEFYGLLNNLEKWHDIEYDENLEKERTIAKNLKKRITLEEQGQHVLFYPYLYKGSSAYNILKTDHKVTPKKIAIPDKQEIKDFKEEFHSLHKRFSKLDDTQTFTYLHRDEYIKEAWHLNFFERCKELKIEITGLEELENIKFSSHKAVIETELNSSIDWFELDVILSFGKEKIERKKWIKAIKEGHPYVELADGSLGLIPEEWFKKMTKIITMSEVTKKGLRINKLRFNVIDDLFDKIKDKATIDDIKKKKTKLKSYNTNKKVTLPKGLKAKLRPYQKEAYQWLKFLESCHFGGILADDMGLGKTLQIITLLASAKEKSSCHALVIVPKSLVFNWVNEINKFYPDLTHHIHHGIQRHDAKDDLDNADIVISTYGTITRDIQKFQKKIFTHIILDESQAIKNVGSKRYKAIRLLQSPFKLCATGTPIQNNTFDLYAQASFANPGLLGNQSFFRQNFATAIDKNNDKEASDLLLKMIHPFILRRTKEQVAKDLPDKVESIIYCEMYPHQRTMYEDLKNQIRRDLLAISEDDSKLRFMVLDGLLRLRQLCNAPLLVDKTLTGEGAKSIKIDSLLYKLTEEIGDGNALVFSQFTQMLGLIRAELDERKIPYAYLDGSTRKREEVVNAYMNDDNCKIFLISLKAGNTGLNLTKAQYVFIVDPWWNPAAEAQAIDRTHRIGQNKKVFAYKMICQDSVEEKIILLQNRKKKVASQLIKIDETSFKKLNKKDMLALFE